jgi:hypothetical protein
MFFNLYYQNFKICTMKKISAQLFLFAFSIVVFAGCSKQVKAPVNKTQATASSTQTTTTTQTTNQNQGGHTCGGDHTSSGGNGY